jgi:hypothetical protein
VVDKTRNPGILLELNPEELVTLENRERRANVVKPNPLERTCSHTRLLVVGTLAMLVANDQNAQVFLAIPFGIAWVAVGYVLWCGKGMPRAMVNMNEREIS